MKSLFFGIVFILIVGIGGLVYRNAVEHPLQPIACPLDALVCPNGVSVAREGSSCSFPACPAPNTSISSIAVAFAIPEGFESVSLPDTASVAAYEFSASPISANIVIRRYNLTASSTALEVIRETALEEPSGNQISQTSFSSQSIAGRNFTTVPIERAEGVIRTAYYLRHGVDLLRFDATDTEVTNWTDPTLTLATLPAHAALITLLTTLKGQ